MFENPRRGRQASNFTTNVPINCARSQIVSRTDIFRKLSLGAPVLPEILIIIGYQNDIAKTKYLHLKHY